MNDDAIREAAAEAVHDFLIECGLTDDESDTAAIRVEKAVRPLIEADLRERLAAAVWALGHGDYYHGPAWPQSEAGVYCAVCAVATNAARVIQERP